MFVCLVGGVVCSLKKQNKQTNKPFFHIKSGRKWDHIPVSAPLKLVLMSAHYNSMLFIFIFLFLLTN